MLAHIYVADSPYYALTGADGSFSITDVPPGNYTLVASQDYAGDTEMPVTVKGGETAKLADRAEEEVASDWHPTTAGRRLCNEEDMPDERA